MLGDARCADIFWKIDLWSVRVEAKVEMNDEMRGREGGADMNWFLRYRRKSTADFRWECAHDVHTNLSTINPQIPCSQFPPVIIHYSHIWLFTLHVIRELTLNAGLTAAQHWRYRLHIRLDSPTLAEPANSETHCLVKLLYWTPVLYQGNWIGRGSTIQVPSYCCTTFALL